jgi:hypothetical protein
MIVKEATYKTCKGCGTKHRLTDETYGCDECRKPIDRGGEQRQYLQATVFKHGEESKRLEFCSWRCCLKGLRKVKSDYFVSLPFLHYDERQKGVRARDFFTLLRPTEKRNT